MTSVRDSYGGQSAYQDKDGNLLSSRMAPGDLAQTPATVDSYTGGLSSSSTIDWNNGPSGEPYEGYYVSGLTAGEVVTVQLTSSAFQAVAFAQPPGGNSTNWLIDQGSLGGGNAWLTFTVGAGQAGTWVIGATSASPTASGSVGADGSGPNDTHYATTTVFNALGNPVTDADGNTVSTLYNNLNQPVATVNALGYASFDVYDLDGDVTLSVDANGQAIQDAYNAVGEQTEENWLVAGVPASAGASIFHTINTYYDADGETVGVTETDTQNSANATNYEYTYTADGNVLTSRMAPGDMGQSLSGSYPFFANALTELDYTYNADGSAAKVSDSSNVYTNSTGGYVDYTYNALAQVATIEQGRKWVRTF
jgi:YD repeat-containing protein